MAKIEIEHKYLIRRPDHTLLLSMPGACEKHILQTYLQKEDGRTRRVRKTEENGKITYTYNEKKRLSSLSAEEYEKDVDEGAYLAYLQEAAQDKCTLEKTRVVIPFAGHQMEIDLYPRLRRVAILEVELQSEDEAATLPPYLSVLREVSADIRYKNTALAGKDTNWEELDKDL